MISVDILRNKFPVIATTVNFQDRNIITNTVATETTIGNDGNTVLVSNSKCMPSKV